MIVGLYGVSLCLLMPSVLCIDGFGELGELGEPCGRGTRWCGTGLLRIFHVTRDLAIAVYSAIRPYPSSVEHELHDMALKSLYDKFIMSCAVDQSVNNQQSRERVGMRAFKCLNV